MKNFLFCLVFLLFVYFLFGVSLILKFNVNQLIVYQLLDFRFVSLDVVKPIPFGKRIAEAKLVRDFNDNPNAIFLYDLALFPEALEVESKRTKNSLVDNHERVVFKLARYLLDAGFNVDAKDSRGCTSLQYAVHDENERFVEFLIDNGASSDIYDVNARLGFCRVPPSLS